jgi:hypothetical protein
MASPAFRGVINVDIRDSTPDWAPFEPPTAPEGALNVVYVVLDDVGFSAMSCYGGPIPTPNIDRIAADGVRFTQWHTTALCSPTRSCLLTGRNHTRNSMACIRGHVARGYWPRSQSRPLPGGVRASKASSSSHRWMSRGHGTDTAVARRRLPPTM